MEEKINKILDFMTSRTMNVIDYLGAIACLLWSLKCYLGQEEYILYLSVGIIALIVAYFRPTVWLINKTRQMQPRPSKGEK